MKNCAPEAAFDTQKPAPAHMDRSRPSIMHIRFNQRDWGRIFPLRYSFLM